MFWNRLPAALLAALAIALPNGFAATAHAQEIDQPTVVAGTGTKGYSGDGGPAASAALNRPAGVPVAADGTLYISDNQNYRVRAISPAGVITTVVGTGRPGVYRAPFPDGAKATDVNLSGPENLAFGRDGVLYFIDGLYRVLALKPDGRVSLVAGIGVRGTAGDNVPAKQAALGQLGGLAVAPDGTVYIADMDSRKVRAISPSGAMTTVVDVEQYGAAEGGAFVTPAPQRLAIGADGALWIVDAAVLRRFSDGKITTPIASGNLPTGDSTTTWELSTALSQPSSGTQIWPGFGFAVGGDGVYMAGLSGIFRVRTDRVLEMAVDFSVLLKRPVVPQLTVGPSGDIYVADEATNSVYSFKARKPAQVKKPEDERNGRSVLPWLVSAAAAVVAVLLAGWLLRRTRRAEK